ncbi:MAG: hypothetical protein FWG38_11660, partial [Defluviitaleaceae bacterium]|nr:hypothetical protein [Defluviitaleaceae bacterium]
MIRLIFIALQVRFTMMSNRIIHLLRLHSAYGNYALKMVVTIIGALFVINFKTTMHLIYVAILFGLGVLLNQSAVHGGVFSFFGADDALAGFTAAGAIENALVVWFFISIVGAPLLSFCASGFNHANDNMMVNYLRANPATYVKSRILTDCFAGVFLYLFTFAIAFIFLTDSTAAWFAGTVAATAIFLGARLMGDAVNMWLFKRFGKYFAYYSMSTPVLIPLYLASIAVPYFLGTPNIVAVLTNPITMILAAVVGVVALLYIKKYPLLRELLNDKINHVGSLYATAAAKQAGAAGGVDVKNWSKGLETTSFAEDKHANKQGFSYLNAIFFDRHRKYFTKKLLTRCLILLAPLAAAALLALYGAATGGNAHIGLLQMEDGFDGWLRQSSIILFIVYVASMGRIVTASVFSNCDVQMLNYPYYHKADTILASFKVRFAVILRYNFIITTVAFVSVVGAAALFFGAHGAGLQMRNIAMLFVALTCTGIFFAFNDLFLYYVIQPYDSEGKDKSIVSKIINWIVYGVSWVTFFSFQFS